MSIELSGRWSSDWGEATLEVADGKLTGSWKDGSLAGSVDGAKVSIDWTHTDGTTGKATLTASDDGASLAGTWGWADDKDGGDWSLSLVEAAKKPAAKKPAAKKAAAKKAPAKKAPAKKAAAKKGEDEKAD